MIDKIKEAVILWKAWNCDLWVKQELKALLDLAERYITVEGKMPAKSKHNDYCGINNKRDFLPCDCGVEEYNKAINECTIITTKLLAEKDNEIERYKKVIDGFMSNNAFMLTAIGDLLVNSDGMRKLNDEILRLKGAVLSKCQIAGALLGNYNGMHGNEKLGYEDMAEAIHKAQQDKLKEVNG